MPHHSDAALTSGRAAIVLGETLRRIDRAIPDQVDLDALRKALETKMAKGSYTPFDLMRVGLRWALDHIGGQVRNEARRRRFTTI